MVWSLPLGLWAGLCERSHRAILCFRLLSVAGVVWLGYPLGKSTVASEGENSRRNPRGRCDETVFFLILVNLRPLCLW